MMVNMLFTIPCGGRTAVRAMLAGALAILGAAAAGAQVIEVGDDGGFTVHRGAAVTTADGVEPIVIEERAPVARFVQAYVPTGALEDMFTSAAHDFGVDPRLLHAVAWHESRFRQDAVSNKGAVGVMQLMPETARTLGVNPADVVQNIRGGAALLAQLLRRFGGDVRLTLAAYNAGPGSVLRYGGVPPFPETQNYVAQILQRLGS
jgi:soluble lytic murein transglycosylase-like protein